ncbi:unnamed protein product [Parnassius mnemosyne]|uniref:Uncharacterized protein n=2 Tax=Parnassius mnemosyne TaxID=213953 RepID=A0AAV1M058_9NEOP
MGAMLFLAISACMLITCANAEYSIKCNNQSESGMSFEPSTDGVKGRYTVVWCTEADENVTEWDLIIRYYETRKPEKCKHYDLKHPPPLGLAHSRIRQDVNISPDCTNACFSTSVDLIFQACYAIKSMLLRGTHSSEGHDSFHYVRNNFTKVGSLRANTPAVKFVNYNDHVSAIWFLGSVPAAKFTMDICRINVTLPSEGCLDVTDNCTSALYDISCHLSPPHGYYSIRLVHFAPWVYGRIAVESAQSEFGSFPAL